MICGACHKPTRPETSGYSEALAMRVCFDCIRRLRGAKRLEIERLGTCGVCHNPTQPETSAYHEALAMLVCLDCIKRLHEAERRIASLEIERIDRGEMIRRHPRIFRERVLRILEAGLSIQVPAVPDPDTDPDPKAQWKIARALPTTESPPQWEIDLLARRAYEREVEDMRAHGKQAILAMQAQARDPDPAPSSLLRRMGEWWLRGAR